jgi:putative ABC transport system permease protein
MGVPGPTGSSANILFIYNNGCTATAALLLTAIGIYGLVAVTIRERTVEIGVRMALGAAPGTIFRLVIAETLRLVALATLVSLTAAVYLSRLMASILIGVRSHDPATYSVVSALLFVVAGLSSSVAALRVVRLEPTKALRAT